MDDWLEAFVILLVCFHESGCTPKVSQVVHVLQTCTGVQDVKNVSQRLAGWRRHMKTDTRIIGVSKQTQKPVFEELPNEVLRYQDIKGWWVKLLVDYKYPQSPAPWLQEWAVAVQKVGSSLLQWGVSGLMISLLLQVPEMKRGRPKSDRGGESKESKRPRNSPAPVNAIPMEMVDKKEKEKEEEEEEEEEEDQTTISDAPGMYVLHRRCFTFSCSLICVSVTNPEEFLELMERNIVRTIKQVLDQLNDDPFPQSLLQCLEHTAASLTGQNSKQFNTVMQRREHRDKLWKALRRCRPRRVMYPRLWALVQGLGAGAAEEVEEEEVQEVDMGGKEEEKEEDVDQDNEGDGVEKEQVPHSGRQWFRRPDAVRFSSKCSVLLQVR
jgi:hypothetical protein